MPEPISLAFIAGSACTLAGAALPALLEGRRESRKILRESRRTTYRQAIVWLQSAHQTLDSASKDLPRRPNRQADERWDELARKLIELMTDVSLYGSPGFASAFLTAAAYAEAVSEGAAPLQAEDELSDLPDLMLDVIETARSDLGVSRKLYDMPVVVYGVREAESSHGGGKRSSRGARPSREPERSSSGPQEVRRRAADDSPE
jgi:hypothetical protein